MIIFQVILVLTFIAIGGNFMRSRHSSKTKAYKKILLLLSIPFAITFVLFPELSNHLARMVGVGRGADLLLYGLTVVILFQLFNNYLKDKEEERKIVELARNV